MTQINLPNGFFNDAMTVYVNLEVPKSNPLRKIPVDSTFRAIYHKGFSISVDNSAAQSHNINIDYPTFFCWALTEKEAIEKMMQSDFAHKKSKIHRITIL